MGKFDIVGDIHGCMEELEALLEKMGYHTAAGNKLIHPQGRTPVFLGDLTDRGPASAAVLEHVTEWVRSESALYCPGNHCNKLYRYLIGNRVTVNNGLETTIEEMSQLPAKQYKKLSSRFINLYETSPLYLILDNHRLVVAHAGIQADMIGIEGKKIKTFVLYGDITGETHQDGRPVRRDWAAHYSGKPFVVYGHTPVSSPRQKGRTINIDTGCVFGGRLSAYRWPEQTLVSVPSRQPLIEEKFHHYD